MPSRFERSASQTAGQPTVLPILRLLRGAEITVPTGLRRTAWSRKLTVVVLETLHAIDGERRSCDERQADGGVSWCKVRPRAGSSQSKWSRSRQIRFDCPADVRC